MRKILGSIITIGVIAALMGVGTFAYFSDTESADFTINTGVIDLEVDGENPWCESFTIHLKPSWDWERDFILHMTAESNPAKVCFRIKDLQDKDYVRSEPELWAEGAVYNCTTHEWDMSNWSAIDNVSDHIRVDISFDSTCPCERVWYIDDDGDGDYEWMVKLPNWNWKQHIEKLPTLKKLSEIGWIGLAGNCDQCGNPYNLTPCTNYIFHLSFHNTLNGDDNEYQGDSTTFTLEFYATQLDNPECGGEGEEKADIGIVKTVDNPNPHVGDTINFTVVVTNHGPNDATGVKVKDILPDELEYISSTTTKGTYNPITGIWNIGDMYSGEEETLTIEALVNSTSQQNEFTQLAMVLDGSGSISGSDWNIMLNGLANAIENASCFPHDGSVELTVIQFGDEKARVEVQPVIINNTNFHTVADEIRNINKINGWTPMACSILLAADTLYNSPNFDPSNRQVINLVTDGKPNRCCDNDGDYNADPCSGKTTKESTENARDYLITKLQMTEGQDEFDVEVVGTQSDPEWLKNKIVWPQPGNYAPPFIPGWVRNITDWQEFANTICEKFQVIFSQITNTAEIISSTPIDPNPTNDISSVVIIPQS